MMLAPKAVLTMRLASVMLAVALAGCVIPAGLPKPLTDLVSDPDPSPSPSPSPALEIPTRPPPAPPMDPVRFLAMGDGGYGNPQQYVTAHAAATVCARDGCDLVLLLGDNIYEDGPTSARDPQFEEKFERPYGALSLPFYVVLGNHDAHGAQHELDYAKRTDRLTERWKMPARQYAFDQGPARFVALDLTGPDGVQLEEARRLLWSDATWTIAFSHFPLRSNGRHGDAPDALRWSLTESVCKRADLYLSGHDHDLQWLAPPPECPRTELVVSGAVGKARPLRANATNPAYFQAGDTHGFFWFEVGVDLIVGRAYDDKGKLLYERAIVR